MGKVFFTGWALWEKMVFVSSYAHPQQTLTNLARS